jgi:hypothetical protein
MRPPSDYVLNQLIETTLVKDHDFMAWRADHPDERPHPHLASTGAFWQRCVGRAPRVRHVES